MQNGGQGSGFFAKGLSFYKLTWVFVLGSLVGTWYEEILTFVTEGVYETGARSSSARSIRFTA